MSAAVDIPVPDGGQATAELLGRGDVVRVTVTDAGGQVVETRDVPRDADTEVRVRGKTLPVPGRRVSRADPEPG